MVDISHIIDNPDGGEIETIEVHYEDKDVLYKAYMPFIKQGALFVKTNKDYDLNVSLNLQVRLLNEPLKVDIKGKVVWRTPTGAQRGMPAGIGVQLLGEEADKLRKKIDTFLAGMLKSDNSTDTM